MRRLIPATFVLLWATGFIGARYAMPYAEPFTFLALRFALAFAILGATCLLWRGWKLSMADAGKAAVAGLLLHGIYLGGVFWAVHRGLPAGLSALIAGLQPLITAILAGPVLGETVLPRHWAGLAAGFAGVLIVLLPKLGAATGAVTWPMLAASLIAVAGISLGTIWQKRFAAGTDIVANTVVQYAAAALLTGAGSLAFEQRQVVWSGELFFALGWLTLVLSIGAIFLLLIMIRDGEMAKVSSLFYLVPAVTALMAWALFGERLSVIQIAGMALATFGVALATSRARRDPPEPA